MHHQSASLKQMVADHNHYLRPKGKLESRSSIWRESGQYLAQKEKSGWRAPYLKLAGRTHNF